MKNTRIYDRVPVKDVRVKDPQIGTRTPQILISRKSGEYLRGDVLDANATTELAKSIHIPDIDKINDKLEQTVKKDQIGQPNGVAGLDGNGNIPTSQLGNVDVDIFMIVNELPTENIKNNKIYCIKDTESTDENNTYIEYAYINGSWEKVGEFQAEPDLSGYAKLENSVTFRRVTCSAGGSNVALHVQGEAFIEYLRGVRSMTGPTYFPSGDKKENMVYSENGGKIDVGIPEDFVFTLEDGSTVTKSIRVISTTTSQAGA